MNIAPTRSCPVCQGTRSHSILQIPNVPVLCNELHETKVSALAAPRGHMDLHFCHNCTHLFNSAFDPARLDIKGKYEHSLYYSPIFQRFAQGLADRLIQSFDLKGKSIIEIGARQGEFLEMLCANGRNTGIGYDPMVEPENVEGYSYHIYKERYGDQQRDHHADLICCRHVLGEVSSPLGFMHTIRNSLKDDPQTAVYIEVPHAGYLLGHHAILDIVYEHFSYFTPSSLYYLMQVTGFRVTDVRTEFDKQYLSIEAIPNQGFDRIEVPAITTDIREGVTSYAYHFHEKVEAWRTMLESYSQKEKRVVVWGAGTRGSMFLNILRNESNIEYVIDTNPRKQQKFLTGTGQKIEKPSFVKLYEPDVIIIMGETYVAEIEATLEQMNSNAKVILPWLDTLER